MDTLKTLSNNHFYSKQPSAFRRANSARSSTVLMPGNHDQRNFLLLISYRRFVDGKLITTRIVLRHSSFDAEHHQVLDPNIGKRPAGHDQVISTPATITVEIDRLHTPADQILASGRALFNGSCRRDMVSRHRIAKDSQGSRIDDIFDCSWLHREVSKKWRFPYVFTVFIPVSETARVAVPLVAIWRFTAAI